MLKMRPLVVAFSSAMAIVMTVLLTAAPANAITGGYVALGDSYSSGVGSGSESGGCLQSPTAYPGLWNAAHHPSSYRMVACSGAKTTDVNANQLSALSSSTGLVSITVGGNDVGFSDIMTTCVLYSESACVAAVNRAEAYANANLANLLNVTYNGIRSRAPYARVVVLSYPVFYQLGVWYCVGLSETSRAKIDEGINLVDNIIKNSAIGHGFVFADVRSKFVGHQLCSGDKWLHSLNYSELTKSYHPTGTGQSSGYLPVFTTAAG
ncbi:MAG TPA: SGNH/GDSL hydrolase family protein [Jatrophihabitans sp.]|jgi:lysophospholipase L1-like esterase|uniref:SGNH/GDSL hydrolase family protein n=1 Tax=Jatrophihabitans sp. TaxID=1932789 RepID=UPI002F0C6BE1